MKHVKLFEQFLNEYNKFTGDEVAQHIEDITPDESDIPDYFIDKFIKPNDGWELKQIKLKDLLKDRDFKGYYNSGEERYDEYEVDPNDLYNDLVVYKGKLLDGYSRASKMLRDGEKTAGAYVLESNSTNESLVNEAKRPEWQDSDFPDAEGRFRDLSIKDLAAWLIKTRKKDLKAISGSLTQQYVFNRNDDPEYAEKMQKTRKEVYKQLGRKDLIDKMDENKQNEEFIIENASEYMSTAVKKYEKWERGLIRAWGGLLYISYHNFKDSGKTQPFDNFKMEMENLFDMREGTDEYHDIHEWLSDGGLDDGIPLFTKKMLDDLFSKIAKKTPAPYDITIYRTADKEQPGVNSYTLIDDDSYYGYMKSVRRGYNIPKGTPVIFAGIDADEDEIIWIPSSKDLKLNKL